MARLKTPLALLLMLFSLLAQAGELTISAAASLTNAFREIASAFETQHPETKVLLNFGASGGLLQQMIKGAPVDVFASADQETMDLAEKEKLVARSERHDFASNALVLIVPQDSKITPRQLAALEAPEFKRIAIGNPASVPVGRYSKLALETAGLWGKLEGRAILTQNVRQSLDYVARGEVDAGFVYATDAALLSDKVRVAFTVPLDQRISYPIASLAGSTKAKEAQQFVRYVLSPAGQAILGKYGFLKP